MNEKEIKAHTSSASVEWGTPQSFFDKLSVLFGEFTLDPAATPENAKCPNYYTAKEDGLVQPWGFGPSDQVFCNPPYKRGVLAKWIKKGWEESCLHGNKIVMLLPARTDTRSFHDIIYKYAEEVLFVKGRLKFVQNGKDAPALFPSMIVVFHGHCRPTPGPLFGVISAK